MIIFVGVAGSGKSLQGKLLADELGYPWLSTGEFLRMLVSGERRKEMLEGKLLPDNEIIEVVSKIFSLINTQEEFILDGFPRTEPQAAWLLDLLEQGAFSSIQVIHLAADKTTVRKRLLARGRKDDHADAIDARFDEYEEGVRPILSMFRHHGVPVDDIDAEQSVEDIHENIKKVIG